MSSSIPDPSLPPQDRRRPLRHVIPAVLLAASLALTARTFREARRHEGMYSTAGVTPFADAAEHDRRMHDVIGTFATGSEPGDRVIVVQADGHVRFHPVGPLQDSLSVDDTFQLASRGQHVCLVTKTGGTLDALNIDQLAYFDDVYQRTR